MLSKRSKNVGKEKKKFKISTHTVGTRWGKSSEGSSSPAAESKSVEGSVAYMPILFRKALLPEHLPGLP